MQVAREFDWSESLGSLMEMVNPRIAKVLTRSSRACSVTLCVASSEIEYSLGMPSPPRKKCYTGDTGDAHEGG